MMATEAILPREIRLPLNVILVEASSHVSREA
jgi:hypothetical protein